MARNEEHTIQFLAKMMWKYRGTVRLREIMQRLLEFDCIRRNYSKGTLHNLVRQFRAWLKDPNSKHANKLPKAYLVYFEEYKAQEPNTEAHINEDTTPENPDAKCVAEPELTLEEQYALVEKAQTELKESLDKYLAQLEEQEAELDKKYDEINNKKHAASALYYDKNREYEIVLNNLQKQIVWQEMMV